MRIADSTVSGSITGTEKIPVSPTAHITPNMMREYSNTPIVFTPAAALAAQNAETLLNGQTYHIIGSVGSPLQDGIGMIITTARPSGSIKFVKKCIAVLADGIEIDGSYDVTTNVFTGYRKINGYIDQVNTDAPDVTPIEYDTVNSLAFTRDDTGTYRITSNNPMFDTDTTFMIFGGNNKSLNRVDVLDPVMIAYQVISDSRIDFITYDADIYTKEDGLMAKLFFEILIKV